MNKYLVFLAVFFCSSHFFGQEDSVKRTGTIKIAKAKRDSIYIKATVSFYKFQEGHKKDPSWYSSKDAVPPRPVLVANSSVPFDYSDFFYKRAKVKLSDLENKTTDTVRIQLKILDNGKTYYKNVIPLQEYYDAKTNSYKLNTTYWLCMKALQSIESWEPAFVLLETKGKFKGQTVIKAKKKKLTATGILTVIFSVNPFEEQ